MLDARFSHLYFCQSLYTLQRGLPAIAGLLVSSVVKPKAKRNAETMIEKSHVGSQTVVLPAPPIAYRREPRR